MVAVEPHFCHQCGAELVTREVHHRTRKVCPDCGHRHFLNAVPAVTVAVRRGDELLLIDPASGGPWELPGGHPEAEEEPAAAAARELAEETGVRAEPAALSLHTVVHSTHEGRHYTMVTYTVDRDRTEGEAVAGDEASAVAFWSLDRFRSSPTETRRVDRRVVAELDR